jgi:hypothetical protein
MESYFLGSVKLMLIVYGIAAIISFAMAGIIKCLFAGVSFQAARVRAASIAAEVPVPVESERES